MQEAAVRGPGPAEGGSAGAVEGPVPGPPDGWSYGRGHAPGDGAYVSRAAGDVSSGHDVPWRARGNDASWRHGVRCAPGYSRDDARDAARHARHAFLLNADDAAPGWSRHARAGPRPGPWRTQQPASDATWPWRQGRHEDNGETSQHGTRPTDIGSCKPVIRAGAAVANMHPREPSCDTRGSPLPLDICHRACRSSQSHWNAAGDGSVRGDSPHRVTS
mmetsp:Transcript_2134/g.6317  ORF Transcript_2134/g.6317 Transcript_2134/m.6317 type:complete len:218 (-) Transcript_2134:439-1092(-)